jgi:hypothetical protein
MDETFESDHMDESRLLGRDFGSSLHDFLMRN